METAGMKIANLYSHLNGYEFMLVHRQNLWSEIQEAIRCIDANYYVKGSKDMQVQRNKNGHILWTFSKSYEKKIRPFFTIKTYGS